MIISASRRTDIPTYYSEWFLNRLNEGFVYVRNPMNAHQVSEICLTPDVADCIVFWTKNPIPMMSKLDKLESYSYYFQFTLTGYGKDIEPHLPDKKEELIPAFRELSERLGAHRVIWRYDPIAFSAKYSAEYHLRAFRSIAEQLRGHTNKCVISFVDSYRKNQHQLQSAGLSDEADDLMSFAKELSSIAAANGMVVGTCTEKIDLSEANIEHNACIDGALIGRILGRELVVKKDPGQRPECGCMASIDIGTYDTCGAGCKYCYANTSEQRVRQNRSAYDPTSPMLCDALHEEDVVRKREVKSLVNPQLRLFQ